MIGRRRFGAGLRVTVLDRQRRRRISTSRIAATLMRAAALLSVRGREMTLVLGGDRLLKDLNCRFRRTARATDVLAFIADGGDELGDVVVSVETAARQARQRAHSLQHELAILAIHGLLHLLGHDHETDDGRMKRLEARMRRRLLHEGSHVERRRAKSRARPLR